MDFGEATDRLMSAGVTLKEIGDALGAAHTTVRAFRLDPATASYRRPPDGWPAKLAALAAGRGGQLQELAAELEGAAE